MSLEFRNCLEEANDKRRELDYLSSAVIDQLVAAGRFVVIQSSAYYCRVTDAYAGRVRSHLADFATYAEALDYVSKLPERYDDFDCGVSIFPQPARPSISPVCDTEEIPF